MHSEAVYGTLGTARPYRYSLLRKWGEGDRLLMFIGLNPSTATAQQDDPTVRRCWGYAERLGYDGMIMSNLFAYRSTDPAGLREVDDPVGPWTDEYLLRDARVAEMIVLAWGVHGDRLGRNDEVWRLLRENDLLGKAHALKLTKAGHPGHPLYLRNDARPFALIGAVS